MTHVNNTRASITFLKDPTVSHFSCANTQPPIPKIILKRKNGQHYKIHKSKSKRSKMKRSKKSGIKEDLAHKEVPLLKGKVDYNIIPTVKGAQEIIVAIDSSDEDCNSEDECLTSDKNTSEIIEIDSEGEENETPMNDEIYFHEQAAIAHCRTSNLDSKIDKSKTKSLGRASNYLVETHTSRENQNVLPVLSVTTKAPSTKIEVVDLSSDEDDNNNVKSEACAHSTSVKNRPEIDLDLGVELGLTCLQRKKVVRDFTHLSELMYIIINSRRDYSARVLRSERLCLELTSKERTIAEDNYNDIISVYGRKFTQLFLRMESRFSNINQISFMLYNFIAYRLFVGINKIDHHSKISSELVKKLMLLLLKRNFHRSLVFEVFKEESSDDCLFEFESAFLDWSFPEAFIPIED